jgi:hypothetical protein
MFQARLPQGNLLKKLIDSIKVRVALCVWLAVAVAVEVRARRSTHTRPFTQASHHLINMAALFLTLTALHSTGPGD